MFAWCFRLLTLVAFVGHVLLGCCAHHAHASEAASFTVAGSTNFVASHSHTSCGHRECSSTDSQPGESPDHPDDHSDCGEAECSYVELNDAVKTVELSSWVSFETFAVSFLSTTVSIEQGCGEYTILEPSIVCSALGICAQFHSWQL